MGYSDWYLGTIQIELTTLTLRITKDSAKQLVKSPQLTVIRMIRLIGDGNVFYVSPAHRDINTTDGILNLGESYFNEK